MNKKVISFRLSDEELASLEEACRRFAMNRSQVVCAGIATLLRDYVQKDGSMLRRTPWFDTNSLVAEPTPTLPPSNNSGGQDG